MALKDIYINAIQKVIDGTLKKEELWDVFEEHLRIEEDKNNKLTIKYANIEERYIYLLKQLNLVRKEHDKLFGDVLFIKQ